LAGDFQKMLNLASLRVS